MFTILVIGAGKIGSLITFLLAQSNRYHVHLADIQKEPPSFGEGKKLNSFTYSALDANHVDEVVAFIKKHHIQGVISSLPFYCNIPIAKAAAATGIHYFDLTEDVKTTESVSAIAKPDGAAFVPQCGLAPGFISVVAHHLMRPFEKLETVKMRVGALPQNSSNALQYSLTWSTDGLINEYGNPCQAIIDYQSIVVLPLEGLEEVQIDGLKYEAFNTSGGVGSIAKAYGSKVKNLTYKTLRYPGHCTKMKFLLQDLKLNEDRETLKRILEKALPRTFQDVVIVYVSVSGIKDNRFVEESYVKKFYPKNIEGVLWSAIQLTTASEICVIADLVFNQPERYHGYVTQEQFSLDELVKNPFGAYYAQ